MSSLLLAILLSGCDSTCTEASCLTPTEASDAQLESITIGQDVCTDYSCAGAEVAGTLTVTGADQEWTLDIAGSAITAHSSAHSDLATLDQKEVTGTFATDFQGHAAMAILDDSGLAYLAEPTDASLLAPDLLGAGFIRAGDPTADSFVDDDDYEITFTDAIVATDDGEVRALPGEVHTIVLGGIHYRFVLISAYLVETIPNGEYMDCGGRSPMLSFELLRVETDLSAVTFKRPEGMPWAKASCG